MTDEQRIDFIKEKLAPLFDGMNAEDVLSILGETLELKRIIFSRLTVSLNQKI